LGWGLKGIISTSFLNPQETLDYEEFFERPKIHVLDDWIHTDGLKSMVSTNPYEVFLEFEDIHDENNMDCIVLFLNDGSIMECEGITNHGNKSMVWRIMTLIHYFDTNPYEVFLEFEYIHDEDNMDCIVLFLNDGSIMEYEGITNHGKKSMVWRIMTLIHYFDICFFGFYSKQPQMFF
jgi:hypothetical protein